METIKVKPKKGLLVRDPITRKLLKESGEEKPRNPYWLRRIKDKSVVQVQTQKAATTKETEQ